MSRRRKRRGARDGYVNLPARLGGASPLLSAGTYERTFPFNPALLTSLYRESWIAKRIIDMPGEDMTRGWYTLPLEEKQMEELREGFLSEPLDPDTVMPGSFCGLLVRDRLSVTPSAELEDDLNDPDFGYPMYYDLQADAGLTGGMPGILRVHHSRVLRFTGRDLPRAEEAAEQYWGASELEHIWEELQKRSATSANIAQLVFQANITTLRMGDFGEILAMGTDQQRRRVLEALEQENALRTSFGLQLLSAGDTMENHPYSFAGLSQIYEAFMLDMAGAAGIPATRLFGRSPQGMNATGEGDLKNYYELITAMQERHLRPALEKLFPVMAMSLWGSVPERPDITFPSLMPVSPPEEAEVQARQAETITRLTQAGLMTPAEARSRLTALGIL